MAGKVLSTADTVETHKPKNYRYKYIIKDEKMWEELEEAKYDISSLDTINDTDLTLAALDANFKQYPRESVASAKKPTIIEDGVILSKKMATKTDKKLQNVGVGFFTFNNIRYVCIKLEYERFDIIEIFILT